ncbi:histidine kinase [Streptomyces sulfonofaciens]|uniref:Histidine kinase n=1 Tax=Streptomyces sulfonofaciens TaxID=68272 RepID=A0A919GAZ0_9ACTN|nr:sensor histidine kinase [Streptomyces sulfonofaciens]GHH80686.1 histidine kinase [Streptomyces sulfonofaciens]
MPTDLTYERAPAEAMGPVGSVAQTDPMGRSTRTSGPPSGAEAAGTRESGARTVGAGAAGARTGGGQPGGAAAAAPVRGGSAVSEVAALGRAAAVVERRRAQFDRLGPSLLLAAGMLVSLATADLVMSPAGRVAALPLAGAALVLQVWWYTVSPSHRAPSRTTVRYYAVRWALGFALSWVNPFMSLYAVSGYFGAERLLPVRRMKIGLFATAVTLAGAQAGGLPPAGPVSWVLFGAMLGFNVVLVIIFGQMGAKEEERNHLQARTIEELERANTRLQQALDENAALHAQLLVQAREAGVADERRRLAAEIHDTIAQGLTGIIAQLQVVMGATEPDVALEHLEQAAKLARYSLGEARRSVQNLAPAALEHDALPEALEKTVFEWAAREGMPSAFTVTGTAQPLHDEVAATLLRITQEALANAARHSDAARVGVTLSYMDDEVTLDVRDDGRGFDPLSLPRRSGTGGFGLDGMRVRAERIAGTLCVESEPGHGTAVSARVPLVRHDR